MMMMMMICLAYDSLSVHIRDLQSLGISSDQYGSLLTPIMMVKLPNDIRLEIARKSASGVWKIDDLPKCKHEKQAKPLKQVLVPHMVKDLNMVFEIVPRMRQQQLHC